MEWVNCRPIKSQKYKAIYFTGKNLNEVKKYCPEAHYVYFSSSPTVTISIDGVVIMENRYLVIDSKGNVTALLPSEFEEIYRIVYPE